jgi:DNA-binding transcriptional regulator/RsmH inhibitor MraZ
VDLFVGKSECSIDDKRRFSLPPKFRPGFGSHETPSGYTHHLILIPWYGGALAALPESRWEEIQSRLLLLDFTTPDFIEAQRVCLPKMEYSFTDPEGRIMLTPEHQAWLRLAPKGKDRLVVAGMGKYCEIWNAAEWSEVDRTGKNPATRPAPDIEYDKKLEVLMRAGLHAEANRPEVSQPEPEKHKETS